MPKESDAKWYVLHTYSGYENNVASNIAKLVENRGLHEYIYETQIPLELVSDDPSDLVDEEAESKNDDLEIFVRWDLSMNPMMKRMSLSLS